MDLALNKTLKLATLTLLSVLLLSACATPPRNTSDICQIFSEKTGWYEDASDASKRWGSPISTMMAIMHQESSFRANAKPPRTKILWVIPGPRMSDAYGYPQAKDSTWDWYKTSAKQWGADRDDFDDAIDFIGWYNSMTNKKNDVALNDTYNLYLAYHEGHGGYARGSYNKKAWLKSVASKVANRASTYQQQLQGCEAGLKRSSRFWFF